MGCAKSKDARANAYAVSGDDPEDGVPQNDANCAAGGAAVSSPAAKPTAASGGIANVDIPRPKLDPKDFQFVDCKNEVKIKAPGTINGQSFMIDKCENCDIYLLDHCAQVTVDDCKNCRLYIGPTDGSIFIRDSSNCNLAVVCRQLRTRDIRNCKIALYCRTKPIVESSNNVGFSCLDLSYPELAAHMWNAKLSPFHNFWYDIFDFTPKDGNWRLLPGDVVTSSLLGPIPAEAADLMRIGQEALQPSPLLVTIGGRPPPTGGRSYMFAAFDSAKHDGALQLARTAAEKGWLLRTNAARLSPTAAAALATEAGWAKAVGKALGSAAAAAAAKGGALSVGCVGLELSVPAEEAQAVAAQVQQLGGHCSGSEAAGKSFRSAGVEG